MRPSVHSLARLRRPLPRRRANDRLELDHGLGRRGAFGRHHVETGAQAVRRDLADDSARQRSAPEQHAIAAFGTHIIEVAVAVQFDRKVADTDARERDLVADPARVRKARPPMWRPRRRKRSGKAKRGCFGWVSLRSPKPGASRHPTIGNALHRGMSRRRARPVPGKPLSERCRRGRALTPRTEVTRADGSAWR